MNLYREHAILEANYADKLGSIFNELKEPISPTRRLELRREIAKLLAFDEEYTEKELQSMDVDQNRVTLKHQRGFNVSFVCVDDSVTGNTGGLDLYARSGRRVINPDYKLGANFGTDVIRLDNGDVFVATHIRCY